MINWAKTSKVQTCSVTKRMIPLIKQQASTSVNWGKCFINTPPTKRSNWPSRQEYHGICQILLRQFLLLSNSLTTKAIVTDYTKANARNTWVTFTCHSLTDKVSIGENRMQIEIEVLNKTGIKMAEIASTLVVKCWQLPLQVGTKLLTPESKS